MMTIGDREGSGGTVGGVPYTRYLLLEGGHIIVKNIVFFCLKIFFSFTNSVDPDEMQHYAAFHLGLYCLQKYLLRGFPNTKR